MTECIAVTGSRIWSDSRTIALTLARYDTTPAPTLRHGCAQGADTLAAREAERLGWRVEPYPADWKGPCAPGCPPDHRKPRKNGPGTYCPLAGHRRNQEMVAARPRLDLVLAFNLGTSGTADMMRRAKRAGIEVIPIVPGLFIPGPLEDAGGWEE
ncbi:SLOG family protein [Nocardiopsis synnemataformans]|uniref:SLOG family protein n=1 Tax=Nocardiopsis synnemataformans TaxID=61305 RepID=UPI003EB78651